MDYQVDLESFRGPLDLLLYLVKRNEVDICDIPIAKLADQFREYLDLIEATIDIEWAGDFLVMAATLMEIKSKMLLPRNEEQSEEEADPRLELVRQLMEYKQFKDAAALLDVRAEQQLARFPRQPPPPVVRDPSQQPIQAVELWDLVSAFGRLMRETLALQPRQIVMDETPMVVYIDLIQQRLQTETRLALSALFTPPYTRGRLLGLFLAILELIKTRLIHIDQPEPFGDIWLRPAPPPETPSPQSEPVPE